MEDWEKRPLRRSHNSRKYDSIHKIYAQAKTMGALLLAFYLNVKIYSSLSLMTIILFVFPFHFEALQEFDLYSVLNSH